MTYTTVRPRHCAPNDLLRGVGDIGSLVDQSRILAAKLEENRRQVLGGRPRNDLASARAAREEDEVERQLQELGGLLTTADHRGDRARIEILPDEVGEQRGARRNCGAQLQNARVSGRQSCERRAKQEEQRTVEWPDDECHTVGLAIDDRLVPRLRKETRHWRRGRLHPLLELALLVLDLADGPEGLENVLLSGGLEVRGDRLLQACLVLGKHAPHPVELFDSPFVGTRNVGTKIGLLGLEQIFECRHLGPISKRAIVSELVAGHVMVRTMRNRALPDIIFAYASAALSRASSRSSPRFRSGR
nr:hypothetical protein [Labilithrix luteola]